MFGPTLCAVQSGSTATLVPMLSYVEPRLNRACIRANGRPADCSDEKGASVFLRATLPSVTRSPLKPLTLWARPFRTALIDVTIPSQVGFKLFDNDPKQTRSKRISNLPRQKLIMRDLNFLLSELALCHELCPPTNRRRGGRVVSVKFSDHFLWFLISKIAMGRHAGRSFGDQPLGLQLHHVHAHDAEYPRGGVGIPCFIIEDVALECAPNTTGRCCCVARIGSRSMSQR